MKYRVVTDSTLLPVSLEYMKDYLYVDHTSHDKIITTMIKTAAREAEVYLAKPIMAKTLEAYADSYQEDYELPLTATAVSSVKYYDSDNSDITLVADTDYVVYDTVQPQVIHMESELTVYDRPDAVRIQFTIGSTKQEQVDPLVIQAVCWAVAEMYEKRINDKVPNRDMFKSILHPIREIRFA